MALIIAFMLVITRRRIYYYQPLSGTAVPGAACMPACGRKA
jgi:hypothetical protein